jgi:hypothetical protein
VELSDTDRIRNLLGRYCECIDAGDFDGVGLLFAHGTLAGGEGEPFASGATEVAAFYRATTQLHQGRPGTKHLVVDTVFETPDLDGTVEVRSSYVVLQQVGTGALQPIITGRYVDRFGRDVDDDWCFRERRFFVDLVGDLSQHLADPSLARMRED